MRVSLDRWNDFWDRPRVRRRAGMALALLLIAAVSLAIVRVHHGTSEMSGFRRISRVMILPAGKPGAVRVGSGAIVLEPGDPWTGVACTGVDFPDSYRIEFEYRADTIRKDRALGTVVFPLRRCRVVLKLGAHGGCEAGLTGINRLGIDLNGTKRMKVLAPGQWHKVRIQVEPLRIQAWVPPRKIVYHRRLDQDYTVWPSYTGVKPFGIVTNGNRGYVRNVRLRPFREDGPDAPWHSLFDGRTLAGWRAVREFPDRGDMYDVIGHKRAYPPFFAFAFLPFSLGPLMLGAVLFALFNAVAIFLCPWWCVRAMHKPGTEPPLGLVVLVALLMLPMMLNVMVRSETDMMILACVCGGLFLMARSGRPAAAGVLFGFAAAMKLTPGLLALYLLWRRNWRALAGMALGGAVFAGIVPCLVIGGDATVRRHLRWRDEVLIPYGEHGAGSIIAKPYRDINQSLTAAMCRFLTDTHPADLKGDDWHVNLADWPTQRVRKLAGYAKLALLALLLAVWWGKDTAQTPVLRALTIGTALIGMLEISEVSLTTHHVVLMIPLAAGLVLLNRPETSGGDRRVIRFAIFASCAAFALITVPPVKVLSPALAASFILLGMSSWLILRRRFTRRS